MTAAPQCRVCGSADLRPLWSDQGGNQWSRCAACGSDTSSAAYSRERYGAAYVEQLLAEEEEAHGRGAARSKAAFANHGYGLVVLDNAVPGKPGRTFLDVGTGHGASQEVMRAAGWATCGWDVDGEGRPPGTVVSPEFRADLFARPFDAVMAREVLEHAPDPHGLLRQLRAATATGGVLVLSTPAPAEVPHPLIYQPPHLAVWHPDALAAEVARAGFEIEATLPNPFPYSPIRVCRPRPA